MTVIIKLTVVTVLVATAAPAMVDLRAMDSTVQVCCSPIIFIKDSKLFILLACGGPVWSYCVHVTLTPQSG